MACPHVCLSAAEFPNVASSRRALQLCQSSTAWFKSSPLSFQAVIMAVIEEQGKGGRA